MPQLSVLHPTEISPVAGPNSWDAFPVEPEYRGRNVERICSLFAAGYLYEEAQRVERLEAIESSLSLRLVSGDEEVRQPLEELQRHLRTIQELVFDRVRLELEGSGHE